MTGAVTSNRSRWLLWTLALVPTLALITASCSTPGASAGHPVSSPADGTLTAIEGVPGPLSDAVDVRIGVFPNITHAPGLIALADRGPIHDLLPNADIQVNAFNSGTAAVEAMFANAIDLTFVGPNPAINAIHSCPEISLSIALAQTLLRRAHSTSHKPPLSARCSCGPESD